MQNCPEHILACRLVTLCVHTHSHLLTIVFAIGHTERSGGSHIGSIYDAFLEVCTLLIRILKYGLHCKNSIIKLTNRLKLDLQFSLSRTTLWKLYIFHPLKILYILWSRLNLPFFPVTGSDLLNVRWLYNIRNCFVCNYLICFLLGTTFKVT